jgi:hypothetical protein
MLARRIVAMGQARQEKRAEKCAARSKQAGKNLFFVNASAAAYAQKGNRYYFL